MLSDRQKKVIKMILNHSRGIYANEIAEKMQVSTRTIRNDIAAINLVLKNAQCQIQSSKRSGYFIMQENISRIKECVKVMDSFNRSQVAASSKQRKYFMLGKLIHQPQISLGDMADMLYVSEQTIYKDLNSLIHYLEQKYHFCSLTLENGKLQLKSDEVEIRTLFYRLAKEEIYRSNQLVDIHLYQMVKEDADMEELNDITDYISSFCRSNSIVLSDQMLFVIAWMVFFTMLRSENGYVLTKRVELFQPNEVLVRMLTSLLQDLRFDLTTMDCHLLQNYIETLGFYSSKQNVVSGSEVDEIVEEFTLQMKSKYNMDFTQIPSLFDNFKIHLQFTIKRLLMDYQLTNPLLQEVKVKYAFAYEITMLIVPIIHEHYGLYLSEDEISFLTMYVMPFLRAQKARVQAILVSGTSQSFANMLHVWLHQEFGSRIEIISQIPLYQLKEQLKQEKADPVISDMPIETKIDLPIVEITQLPGESERKRLETFIVKTMTLTSSEVIFHKVFDQKRVLFFDQATSFVQVIEACAFNLYQQQNIDDPDLFSTMTLQREQIYSTHIRNGVYFSHPLENQAKKTGICVAIIKNSLTHAQKPVRIVFVGAHEPKINKEMIHIYDLINKIAASERLVNVLTQIENSEELIDYLERIVQVL